MAPQPRPHAIAYLPLDDGNSSIPMGLMGVRQISNKKGEICSRLSRGRLRESSTWDFACVPLFC
jgi:hypothetical protein